MTELRAFQRRFVAAVERMGTGRCALSLPRANGKSWLAGHLIARSLTPGDRLFVPGAENILLSGSFDQARYCFRFAKQMLGEDGYRYRDSTREMGIHGPQDTNLKVISSRGKGAFGIVGARLAFADEPGAWEVVGGELMSDAIDTSLGKPGTNLTVVYIGTLAPSVAGWWHDLIDEGSGPGVYVQALRGDPEKWDRWSEIRRCNPLTSISPAFREKLLQERDKARRDERLKARFMSYRLNTPRRDARRELLTPDQVVEVFARPVPERDGAPVVGIDLGADRSWSAAVALWPNQRTELIAITPGRPSLREQERRDTQPTGTYERLRQSEHLIVAEGIRVPPPSMLVDAIWKRWGRPLAITCDRFKAPELADAVAGRCPIIPRKERMWSESTADIEATRRMALDGNLSVEPASRLLMALSLRMASVESDDGGSMRMVKGKGNRAVKVRDDAACAFVLAAGVLSRTPKRGPVKIHYV